MKKDIENREDIFKLMQEFYTRLLKDESMAYIFTDVAKIDLDHHLPILTDFWEMILFQSDTYGKNVLKLHVDLNHQTPLLTKHFNTWLSHFNNTVDELFEGDKAFFAKERAKSIATIMQVKIAQLKQAQ